MSDPFVAEIRIFGFNFPPKGWAFCNGQLLPISQNTALFSLLGTNYGGDGKSNFALPDLQGMFPLGQGSGVGLSQRFVGETSGTANVTLLQTEMPIHNHVINATSVIGDTQAPGPGTVIARSPAKAFHSGPVDSQMSFNALGVTGSSFPHNNLPPYLAMNFCIAMQGIFPPRG
jgi:microcystin-dependent protein